MIQKPTLVEKIGYSVWPTGIIADEGIQGYKEHHQDVFDSDQNFILA